MKKIILIILVILSASLLASCNKKKTKADSILERIEIKLDSNDSKNNVRKSFEVPLRIDEYQIRWNSNNNSISIVNNQALVSRKETDIEVVLTATVIIDLFKYEKTFKLVVKAIK